MVQFYVLQIKMGRTTIDDVPVLWCEQVESELSKTKKTIDIGG